MIKKATIRTRGYRNVRIDLDGIRLEAYVSAFTVKHEPGAFATITLTIPVKAIDWEDSDGDARTD